MLNRYMSMRAADVRANMISQECQVYVSSTNQLLMIHTSVAIPFADIIGFCL